MICPMCELLGISVGYLLLRVQQKGGGRHLLHSLGIHLLLPIGGLGRLFPQPVDRPRSPRLEHLRLTLVLQSTTAETSTANDSSKQTRCRRTLFLTPPPPPKQEAKKKTI